MTDPWKAGFARFLDAAEPYLDQIVIAGGWASRLYRLCEAANEPEFAPLRTKDVDAATPRTLQRAGREPLHDRMIAFDFKEQLSGDQKPPIAKYELENPDGFEVEFITNLSGRHQPGDDTVAIAGVSAQKLRYVDLLFVSPWSVVIECSLGYPIRAERACVRIPNPVAYIVQKLLIHEDRGAKAGKDVLYIHDTLELFGDSADRMLEEWREVRENMHARWKERCRQRATEIGSAGHRHVIAATRVAQSAGRSLDAQRAALVLRAGLSFVKDE